MLNDKLKNALEHPKSTLQGVFALILALGIFIFSLVSDGVSSESLTPWIAEAGLFIAAIQRIFFAKDK